MKQTLTLVRKSDNDAIYRAAAADAGKVTLDKVSWFMPHVLPADAEKLQLYKTIESKASLPVAYRMRQCDSITVPQSTSFYVETFCQILSRKTPLCHCRVSNWQGW